MSYNREIRKVNRNIRKANKNIRKANKNIRKANIKMHRDILKKVYGQTYLDGFDFSLIMQDLLISDGGYVIDTGNYENVNRAVVLGLIERIKKHPLLWKMFFMVA